MTDCSICGQTIEPEPRYWTAEGEPKHMLCNAYGIFCGASGDRAEAEDLGSALVAADTLARDWAEGRGRGALDAARARMVITLNGRYDSVPTAMARQGRTTP